MKFSLPQLPPTANNIYINVKRGGRIKSAEYRAWIELNRYSLEKQFDGVTITAPVRVVYTFMRPDKRRRDVANLEKATSDLLVKAGVLRDDCQITDMRLRWGSEPMLSPTEITIEVIGGSNDRNT